MTLEEEVGTVQSQKRIEVLTANVGRDETRRDPVVLRRWAALQLNCLTTATLLS